MPQTILIVGLGQLGASTALAIKKYIPAARVIGVDAYIANIRHCIEESVIDEGYASIEGISEPYDFAVIATPTSAIAGIVTDINTHNKGALITDTGSIKHSIISALPNAINFVPAHPLAGRERAGAAYANADIFADKKIVITPCHTNTPAQKQMVENFWQNLKAITLDMEAKQHDEVYAVISHLVQLLAYAYAEVVVHAKVKIPAEDAFRKFFRLYASDKNMWADIFCGNVENIKPAALYFVGYFTQANIEIINELPVFIASSLNMTVKHFSEIWGVNLKKYAAGAYPDFSSPASEWPAYKDKTKAQIGSFVDIVMDYISLAETKRISAIKGRIENMQNEINGIS